MADGKMMKALYLTEYCPEGSVAESISFGKIPCPIISPKSQEVLIGVKASAVNADDIALSQNTAMGGWFVHTRTPSKKLPHVPGCEYAGVVLAIGSEVKNLKAGDRVCGVKNPIDKTNGTWAEQTVALEKDIIKIPSDCDITDVQAASCGMSALVSGDLYKRAKLPRDGSRCLVYGASGGLGTVMVQLLKAHGNVYIVGVCSGSNAEMVIRLGADEAIDYKKSPVADQLENHKKFDVVFDFVGGSEPEQVASRVLKKGGKFITAVGPTRGIGDRLLSCCEFSGWACGLLGRILKSLCCCCCTRMSYEMGGGLPPVKAEDFNLIVVKAGVRPEIAFEAPFEEGSSREALGRVASRHTKGKVVLCMEL